MSATTSPSTPSHHTDTTVQPVSGRRVALAVALDAAFVLVFTLVGRRSHDEEGGLGPALGTAAPFLLAVAIVWGAAVLVARRRGDLGVLWRVDAGVLIALGTTLLGALFRRFLWSDSTALVFVIVTGAFLIACFVGWRLLDAWWRRRRAA